MKKTILLIAFSILSFLFAFSQENDNLFFNKHKIHQISNKVVGDGYFFIKDELNISPDSFFTQYGDIIGMTKDDEFRLHNIQEDKFGNQHYRFNQFYKGIEVDGIQYVLHVRNGRVYGASGKIVKNLDVEMNKNLSKDYALNKALDNINKEKTNFNSEDYSINPIITIKNKETINNKNFTLAYKIDFKAIGKIYVDAKNGALIKKEIINENISNKIKPILQSENKHNNSTNKNNINSGNKGASKGNWEFNIDQNFMHYYYNTTEWFKASRFKCTLCFNWEYLLYDECSGKNNLWIYNQFDLMDYYSASSLLSEYNNNVVSNNNSSWDINQVVGTSAFWALQRTRDFFFDYLNLNNFGLNNSNINIKLIYNYGYTDSNWACQAGAYSDFLVDYNTGIIVLGNADDCNDHDHLVSLDIIGHEMTELYYCLLFIENFGNEVPVFGQTASIKESFCDIFGTINERWFWCDECFDYEIGEDAFFSNVRSMSNPHNSGYIAQPEIYEELNFWNYDELGNFDASKPYHINGGVQNKWFYLLAEGGNFNGYHIEGIGVDKAFAIAHQNLKYYFDRYSKYPDVRAGAIASAIDIFGDVCANEVIQTIKAWEAVEVPQTTSNWLVAENIDLLSPCAELHTILSNNDLVYVRAANELTSNCDIYETYQSGYPDKEIHFVANKIRLTEGFRSGGNFRAYTTNCYPLDQSHLIMNNSEITKFEHVENDNIIKNKNNNDNNELNDDLSLTISPNPFTTSTSTTITFSLQQSSKVNIYIIDSYGQKVHEVFNNFTVAGNYDIKLDGADLKPGLYFCIMKTETTREVIKIVKI